MKIFAILLSFLLLFSFELNAQFSQGPLSPSTFSTSNITGSSQNWRDITNADSSDDTRAITADSLLQGEFSDYLTATNFGFTIPSTANILGIEVILECQRSSGNIKNYRSRMIKAGVIQSYDEIASGLWPTPRDRNYVHGGNYSLWGDIWTPSDINNSGFGYAMALDMTSNDGKNHTAMVDHISITVYYDFVMDQKDIYLEGSFVDGAVNLEWQAAATLKQEWFDIERSSDGKSFFPIATVSVDKESIETQSYSYTDFLPEYYPEAKRYYRISRKSMLQDGINVSEPLEIKMPVSISPQFSINQDEGSQILRINMDYFTLSHDQLEIRNLNGQILWFRAIPPGYEPREIIISSENWPGGMYLLHLHSENTQYTKRFFKNQ